MNDNTFAHSFSAVRTELMRRIQEPPPGKAQILTGPRQVGKTRLLLELARQQPDQALYVAADAPEAVLPGWWEQVWNGIMGRAGAGRQLVLLDEISSLPDWSRLLKVKIDRIFRDHLPVHVVATGSSALRVSQGTRETMAGRFERLQLLHWSPGELRLHFRLSAEAAVNLYVRQGGFPGAMAFRNEPLRWRDYIRHSIIEPAIGRDVLCLESVRKPALLKQVFAVAAGHPAEIVSLQKICGQLSEKGALLTVAHYLELLEQAYLVASVPKYAASVVRARAAPPKLLVLNPAFYAATLPAIPDQAPCPPDRWGRWIENACMAVAWNAGQTLHYWRQEPHEVDFIIEGSWGAWAVEVKTGPFSLAELRGLFLFCAQHRRFRPLLLCDPGHAHLVDTAAITPQPWQDFLLHGPPTTS